MKFEELLINEGFVNHVRGIKQDGTRVWEELFENEHTKAEAEKAREVILALKRVHQPKAPFDKEVEHHRLNKLIDTWENSKKRGFTRNTVILNISRIAAIVILTLGLSYLFFKNYPAILINSSSIAKTEVIVPAGEKAEVVLPDGTRIWLNSKSKLVYPALFSRYNRQVYLEGEAFFDVEKVKQSKFIVRTEHINITVLGTEFNIKAYKDDPASEVSVISGSVRVENAIESKKFRPLTLVPSQKVRIPNISSMAVDLGTSSQKDDLLPIDEITPSTAIKITRTDTKVETLWKDQLLVFNNETLEEMAIKMSRWFDLQVRINDSQLAKERYTGKFKNRENIYQVLDAINLTTPIIYEQRDTCIYISSKKKHKK